VAGVHGHGHRHGAHTYHYHFHSHDDNGPHAADPHTHSHVPLTLSRACAVGVVHGLAGSAALILLSVAAAPSFWLALLYVVSFGVGTLAGMALVSAALAIPFRYCASAFPHRLKMAHAIAGCVSIVLGAWLIVEPLLGSGGAVAA